MTSLLSTRRTLLSTSALIVGAVLFFAVNILSNNALSTSRLDLTDSKLYTLSEGTRNILGGLKEPITLRFYISKRLATGLPGISSYATRVEELLEEFARNAAGNINLHVIDPEPFSEEEDRAVAYGLQGVPLSEGGSATFYFGLVGTNALDNEQSIPFFQPERSNQLEYDLAKLVHQLAHPKKPVVAVISTIPLESPGGGGGFMPGQFGEPLVIMEQMRQLFDVRELEPSIGAIEDDVDVLMLIHPKELADTTQYAIDQFVLRGGRALVFVDPYAEADPAAAANPMMGATGGAQASNPAKLFAAWGVKLADGVVAADLETSKKVQFARGARPVVVDYPVWMDLLPDNMAGNDIVTGNLGPVTVATAGVLEKSDGAKTELTPLLRTGAQAMKISTAKLGMFAQPQDLLREFRPEGQFVLAARITGDVESAFPDGAPEAAKNETEADTETAPAPKVPHRAKSDGPINVIVVADTDLLQDRFWVQVQSFLGQRIAIPTANNGSLIVSAIDNLTGSNDLISVRNRGAYDRPFTRVKSLQQDAEQRFLAKEQELQQQLRDTESKINELQQNKDSTNAVILSAEQQREIEAFRQEKVRIRKDLRNVQHELNKNIERMEDTMKFLNIGLMPILVGVGGIMLASLRRKRRRAPKAPTQTAEAAA